MLKIIDFQDIEQWDSIVRSFENYDVYYLSGYVKPYIDIGDGEPFLIYFEKENFRLCYVVQKLDIAEDKRFKSYIPKGEYYDISTPYGYGGPLINNCNNIEVNLDGFFKELEEYCLNNNIISQFIRFNPLLKNNIFFEKYMYIINLKKTVKIDTYDELQIYSNMSKEARNRIRKAKDSGINILSSNNIKEFINIYNETMKVNLAEKYYFFNDKFFYNMFSNLRDNIKLFLAEYNGNIVSASTVIFSEKYMNYHFSGSRREFINLAPNNLLLYEAACWATKRGIKQFHLGGGRTDKSDDSLFRFKKSFNKNGILDFYIGRKIFDKNKFEYLVNIRKKYDSTFNENNNFLIKYRG